MGRKEDWVRASAYSIALKETWPGDGRPRSNPRRRVPCWSGMSGLKYPHHAHWPGATQRGLQWVQSPADTWWVKGAIAPAVSHSGFSPEGRLEGHAPTSARDPMERWPRSECGHGCRVDGHCCGVTVPLLLLTMTRNLGALSNTTYYLIDLQFGSPRRVSLGYR